MPSTPRILYVSTIHLTAVLTAVSLSRAFVRQTLQHWQLSDQIDSAELVVSELVTNALKSTGIPDKQPMREDITAQHIIGVQLRVVDASLYVEVWDRGDGTPAIPEQSLDAEGGRGLFLVASVSQRWDIYRPAVGGKVTWAELTLTELDYQGTETTPYPRRMVGLVHPQRRGTILTRSGYDRLVYQTNEGRREELASTVHHELLQAVATEVSVGDGGATLHETGMDV